MRTGRPGNTVPQAMVRSRHRRDRTGQSSAGEGFGGMTVEEQGAVAGQRDAGTRTRLAPPGGSG